MGRFCYRSACFSERQNTTYTEGTVFLIYIQFEKTNSEEHIVRDAFGYTGPAVLAKRPMRPRCSHHFEAGTLESSHKLGQTEREQRSRLK